MLDNYLALPAGSPGLAVAQQYVGNPNGFVYALATRYFQVTTAAVRMYDTHHLILGVKAEAQEIQPQLLEAAQPYVERLQHRRLHAEPRLGPDHRPDLAPVPAGHLHLLQLRARTCKRPIMVGEYSFIASGPGHARTPSPASTRSTPHSTAGRGLHQLHRAALRGLALGGG